LGGLPGRVAAQKKKIKRPRSSLFILTQAESHFGGTSIPDLRQVTESSESPRKREESATVVITSEHLFFVRGSAKGFKWREK
jgi:hypothetical protein